uniref:TolC family protein n=1 Tax=Ningiella ruwaisensis TaxID=2364274 RepID=UPI0010A029F1|nr:TolC family protein [Ningiella ruwaisensis]
MRISKVFTFILAGLALCSSESALGQSPEPPRQGEKRQNENRPGENGPIAKKQYSKPSLSLSEAIQIAQNNDDWLQKSESLERSLQSLSEGATALPDPVLSLSLLNLPVDTFSFDQEAMTQLKVGASQQFPRGDTLALEQDKLLAQAKVQPFLRVDRKNKVALNASILWLDAYEAQQSLKILEQSRPLFDSLSEFVTSAYRSTAATRSTQQDMIRAELELLRLNDRLLQFETDKHVALKRLSQYLFNMNALSEMATLNQQNDEGLLLSELSSTISDSAKQQLQILQASLRPSGQSKLFSYLSEHALVLASEQRVKASQFDTQIARESLKPQYALNASYAYRDDASSGGGMIDSSRADFFSLGLSVSMPLFSSSRQDAQISSSIHSSEALKTEKRLVLRELAAGAKSAFEEYSGAAQRLAVYEKQIIPQMAQYSDTAMNAYTNDNGDFAEVIRAKIAEIDAQLTALTLRISLQKALSKIAYFFPTLSSKPSAPSVSLKSLPNE